MQWKALLLTAIVAIVAVELFQRYVAPRIFKS
jgi:hypothetical protein